MFKNLKVYLTGFTIGGLVAAAAALLYTPYSGEETRQMLRERSEEVKDKTQKFVWETQQSANQILTSKTKEALDEASAVLNQGQEYLNEKRRKVEEDGVTV